VADSFTTNLVLTKPQVGGSTNTWGTKDNANLDALDLVFNADGSGTSVGLNVGSGKVLALGGTVSSTGMVLTPAGQFFNDATFNIRDETDITKAIQFEVSGLTTGAVRVLTVPDASLTIVGTTTTQTLTNKTLTNPIVGTQTALDNSTKAASTAYADAAATTASSAALTGIWNTGDTRETYRTTSASGWLIMDDTSIGSASSAATHAGAQYSALYAVFWSIPDTYCPVTGGRGASAAADFAANKPIALPKVLGRARAIAGAGTSLTSRALGQTVGEETHVLITSEMPSHTHSGGATPGSTTPSTGGGSVQGFGSVPTGSTGGDGAHNNMQPTSFINVEVKL
jgi:hypothetical protein